MPRFDDETIVAHGVTLRPLAESDIAAIALACSDDLMQRWLPLPRPYTEESARQFVSEHAPQMTTSGRGLERAIEVDGEFMGVIGLKFTDWQASKTEAGYWIAPWARGRGLTARALSALTEWILDTQKIARVQVMVAPDNAASLATARRALFSEEGTMRRAGHTHEGPVDLVVLSRLATDPRPHFPPIGAHGSG